MEGLDPDGDWKGHQLEGTNPDIVAGRDVGWKDWIRMGVGRDESGHCRWKRIGRVGPGRGIEETLIGRVGPRWRLEGMSIGRD